MFGFTPSNPWLAVGWRKQEEITLPVAECVGIERLKDVKRST